MTVTQFLTEYEGHEKAELIGGIAYAMAGGSDRHNKIAVNAVLALGHAARTLGCELFINDMALQIGPWTANFPDVMAVCDSAGDGSHSRTKPCLIIEVASPSTVNVDEREKRVNYQRLDSLHEYLIVHHDVSMIDYHYRLADGSWTRAVRNRDQTIETTCLGPLVIDDLFIAL
jgi:Uma2 family endonuclease